MNESSETQLAKKLFIVSAALGDVTCPSMGDRDEQGQSEMLYQQLCEQALRYRRGHRGALFDLIAEESQSIWQSGTAGFDSSNLRLNELLAQTAIGLAMVAGAKGNPRLQPRSADPFNTNWLGTLTSTTLNNLDYPRFRRAQSRWSRFAAIGTDDFRQDRESLPPDYASVLGLHPDTLGEILLEPKPYGHVIDAVDDLRAQIRQLKEYQEAEPRWTSGGVELMNEAYRSYHPSKFAAAGTIDSVALFLEEINQILEPISHAVTLYDLVQSGVDSITDSFSLDPVLEIATHFAIDSFVGTVFPHMGMALTFGRLFVRLLGGLDGAAPHSS